MKARWNRDGGRWDTGSGPLRFTLALRLQYRLGHFLDEQWNAVCALDNVLSDAHGQRLVARNTVDHGVDFALPEPVEGECRYMRPANPRRLKFWPICNDQQHAEGPDPIHGST